MQLEPSRVLPAGLSERELEVLLALAHGGSNRVIADGLGISAKTVGHHVQKLREGPPPPPSTGVSGAQRPRMAIG